MSNSDEKVVSDFGREWKNYNQFNLDEKELYKLFKNYFDIFPFEKN